MFPCTIFRYRYTKWFGYTAQDESHLTEKGEELYDYMRDPNEQQNVAQFRSYSKAKEKMRAMLENERLY